MTLKRYFEGSMLIMIVIIFLCLSLLSFTWLKSTLNENHFDEQVNDLLQYEFPVLAWQKNADRSALLISNNLTSHMTTEATPPLDAIKLWLDPYITPFRSSKNAPSVIQIFRVEPANKLSNQYLYYAGMNSQSTHLPASVKEANLSVSFQNYLSEQLSNQSYSFWTDAPIFLSEDTQTSAEWYYGRILYNQTQPAFVIIFSGVKNQLDFSRYKKSTQVPMTITLSNTHGNLLYSYGQMTAINDTQNTYHKKAIIDDSTHKPLTLYTNDHTHDQQLRYYLENGWVLTGDLHHNWVVNKDMPINYLPLVALLLLLLGSLYWSLRSINKLNEPLDYLYQLLCTPPLVFDNHPYTHLGGEIGNLIDDYYALEGHIHQTEGELTQLLEALEQEVLLKNNELMHTNTLLESSILQLSQQREELDVVNRLLTSNLQLIENGRNRLLTTQKKQSLRYLVSGVAHELNTPIGNAITLSTFIQTEIQQTLNFLNTSKAMKRRQLMASVKRIRTSLIEIEDNIQQAIKIIALIDQLSNAEIAQSETALNLEQFTYWIAMAKISKYPRPIHLHIRCQTEAKRIVCDPSKLRQLIDRLVDNSLDHGFSNGVGNAITISYFMKKGVVYLEYYDDGGGVAFENRQHLLTPFYSSDLGAHKGLGLNLAYNICTTYFKGSMNFDFSRVSGLGVICSLDSAQLDREVV